MTQAELDALKALAEAATPGPWLPCTDTHEGVLWEAWGCTPTVTARTELQADMAAQADAAFIAAARAAVPALIAEVERLQAAWGAEHDAAIRADEQARMAKREVESLRAELSAARNLTMDVRRADNGDVVISVE